jgi:arylsulfatase A
MSMTALRILTIGLVGVLLAAGISSAQTRPPNIVLIFVDDMGYSDIGPFGNTEVRTPHLDKFAAEGMKFTSFYATPVCSMSRACLMTGCYNARVSIPGVLFPTDKIGLNPSEVTLAEIAKEKGYATCAIGKWHLGHHPEFLPTRQGFDIYFGIPYSNDMGMKPARPEFPPLPLIRGETTIETEPDQSQLTRRYTVEAIQFIRAHRGEPFFVYLPHTMIHFPLAVSAAFKDKSKMGLIGTRSKRLIGPSDRSCRRCRRKSWTSKHWWSSHRITVQPVARPLRFAAIKPPLLKAACANLA